MTIILSFRDMLHQDFILVAIFFNLSSYFYYVTVSVTTTIVILFFYLRLRTNFSNMPMP